MTSAYRKGMESLVDVVQRLSYARSVEAIAETVRLAARELTGADGATLVLRDGENCHYFDENAIAPLWKGRRFPQRICISGWVMTNRQHAAIKDIYKDPRIPHEAYRPTFVKSLLMVPIRREAPLGAIGNYWARKRVPKPHEIRLLQTLADSTSVAMENAQLYGNLQDSLREERLAKDEIARQLELRDEFVSVAAHELKTPLTPLKLQSEIFRRLLTGNQFAGHPRESDLRRYSEIIGRQVTDLAQLVEGLLEVSRIRLGRFQVAKTPAVDLAALIREVVEHFQPLSRGVIVARVEEPLIGTWDQVRLRELLQNLVSNAISYGKEKPISIKAVRTEGEIPGVRIEVEDQGIGVPLADRERIFGRFERATSIRSFGGMGLGLFVAREIVHAHGGTIRVEGEEGMGALFIVELPLGA